MINEQSPARIVPLQGEGFRALPNRMIESAECDQSRYGCSVDTLREALARGAALLCEKEAMLQQQEMLRNEADHRLMNGLQMVVSLLSLQSRASINPDVTRQLSVAANRVASIERIHRQLHSSDGAKAVAFKKYLEELCRDFTCIISNDETVQNRIFVEGIDMTLPAATAIPVGSL